MMFWYGGHWAIWPGVLMWVVMLVVLGLLFWAVYALAIATARGRRGGDDRGGAQEILDQRLARGEIDATEYRRLRDLIADDDHQSPADTRSVR